MRGWFTWAALAAQQVGVEPGLPAGTTGFGVQLFQSAMALVGVCVAAWLVLRWIAQRQYGANGAPRNLRVLERVALDPRKSVFLVEAGSRVFLLGASDQSVNTLAELSREDLASLPAREASASGMRFSDVLARIRRTGEAKRDEAPPAAAKNGTE